ncbi:ribonuclease P protein component [Fulvimarina sp. 2208YS6-2-32]|uniref:Ribonuclease P protein component n=1 Tax=Fulvimarina uroteuthidis TaxID=3098149 RepID=A0ABU5I1J8_9HYPH|nr:ribonuclease P protein component [Fulvimarina sp. 2208YS6-2-32]MDY8109243.1 ribonuclease P protein component [Fulvimarina sp. 2208YS6-2-32]
MPTNGRLTKRSEFLAARRGRRLNGPYFFVETHVRGDQSPPRVGLTVTKKIGNAVVRNRIRRRLREAIRTAASGFMRDGVDYVIVARRDVLEVDFADLQRELSRRFGRFDPAAGQTPTKRLKSANTPEV